MSAADKFRKPRTPGSQPSAVDLLIEKGGSVATSTDPSAQSGIEPSTSAVLQDTRADALIKSYVIAAMTVGLVPIPWLDLTALIGLQLKLLRDLCDHYQIDYSASLGRRWIHALVAGSMPVIMLTTMSSFLKLLPGFGTVAGTASVSVLSGGWTYAVGKVFSRHFQVGGDLRDFRPGEVRTEFHRAFHIGRKVARQPT